MQNDTDLIKRAQKGDQLAFEQLIFRYDRQVLNIAMSFRNNADDAKDIYQEVFMRVYRGLRILSSKVSSRHGCSELRQMFASHSRKRRPDIPFRHWTRK